MMLKQGITDATWMPFGMTTKYFTSKTHGNLVIQTPLTKTDPRGSVVATPNNKGIPTGQEHIHTQTVR